MLKEIKKFKGNAVALELTENFTEADEMFAQKLMNEKLADGAEVVNFLIKFKDLHSLEHASIKAIWEDLAFAFKDYKKFGKCAVVADSEATKVLIKIDNVFLHALNGKAEEKYFEPSQLDEAMKFIEPEA